MNLIIIRSQARYHINYEISRSLQGVLKKGVPLDREREGKKRVDPLIPDPQISPSHGVLYYLNE